MARNAKAAKAPVDDTVDEQPSAPTYPRTVELSIDQPGKTTEVADEATFIDLERQGLIRVADVEPSDEEPDEDGETIGGGGSVDPNPNNTGDAAGSNGGDAQ